MQIWIVVKGEKYKGGEVVAVYQDAQKAINLALSQSTNFEGGWVQNRSVGKPFYWENDCDFVEVIAKDLN